MPPRRRSPTAVVDFVGGCNDVGGRRNSGKREAKLDSVVCGVYEVGVYDLCAS